ncbi:MAG: WhiB family transcriptional regulator [Actinomycetota bacterium]|nr:WhiB family transcriptional regulator [Actinomycetota bacterium]MDA8358951.1 WhiB family transcriptional regulator [Actinomycetota bacterium]
MTLAPAVTGDDQAALALVPSRVPTCRRGGCATPAVDDDLGLCEVHAHEQVELRRASRATVSRHRARPVLPAELLDGLAAIAEARSQPWRGLAACRGRTEDMFPTVGRGSTALAYSPALAMCTTCPVVEECREAGAHERHGVWGGTTPAERSPRHRRAGA